MAAQKAISDVTGHPIDSRVRRGATLPPWGPADQLFVVGKCDGLYVSNGESFVTVPDQQYHRNTWMVVERGHRFQHTYRAHLPPPTPGTTVSQPLLRAGSSTVSVILDPDPQSRACSRCTSARTGPGRTVYGYPAVVRPGSSHQVVVVTDPAKHLIAASVNGQP